MARISYILQECIRVTPTIRWYSEETSATRRKWASDGCRLRCEQPSWLSPIRRWRRRSSACCFGWRGLEYVAIWSDHWFSWCYTFAEEMVGRKGSCWGCRCKGCKRSARFVFITVLRPTILFINIKIGETFTGTLPIHSTLPCSDTNLFRVILN